MPEVIDCRPGSDMDSLARCSANIDYIGEAISMGRKDQVENLIVRTVKRLLEIGDRNGINARTKIEGATL